MLIEKVGVGTILIFNILLLFNLVPTVASSSWESFLIAHTIDPNESGNSNYGMWNGEQWRRWLATREDLHHNGPRLTQKSINSVVVSSPTELLNAFNDHREWVLLNNQFVWSNRRFRMYVFLKSGGGYQKVLDCLELYFAARLDENDQPVHLHASNSVQQTSGNANYNFNSECTEI